MTETDALPLLQMTPENTERIVTHILNPSTPTVATWVVDTSIKNSVPDRVKPSFVIFDIRAL